MRTKYEAPKRFWLFNSDGDTSDAGGGSGVSGGSSDSGGDSSVGEVETATSQTQSREIDFDLEGARAEGEKPNWGDSVPEEYKDKPYIQNILKSTDPQKQFFQEMDNLQKKIGERPAGIPKEDAPQDEKDKFYKALGRPEKADDYVFDKPQWSEEDKKIGEFIDGMRNEAYEKEMKQALFEEGLTAKQAAAIARRQDEILLKHNKEFFQTTATQAQALNQDYVETMKKAFGNRASQVEEIGAKIVKENTPDNLKPLLAQLDNKSLAIMSAVLDSVNNKYIKQDGFSQEHTSGFNSAAEARAEGQRLMTTPEYTNAMHPQHEATVKRVNDIYKNLPKK